MITFDEVLDKIRRETENDAHEVNKYERGTRFEFLMKQYFENDSVYQSQFKKVMTWKEYSVEKDGDRDLGIDLVGIRSDGSQCAIQCKCYADDSILDKSDIDTFYAEAAKYPEMTDYMLVFTGSHLGKNAQLQVEKTATVVLMQDNLRESQIDWNENRVRNAVVRKTRRYYQKDAIGDVMKGFSEYDRGRLVMACGTGKTLVSLDVAEKAVNVGGLVLYVVPSLYLIPQTMREWADNKGVPHQYLVVCSDKTADRDANGSIAEILIRPSTNAAKLKSAIKGRRKDAMCVVFATYNSLPIVKNAVKEEFDIILFDEAHKTASSRISYYTMGHYNKNINARKRLYMTATPRVFSEATKKGNPDVRSMDDESIFGPEFHKLRFSDAVDMGILVPFKVALTEVSEQEVYEEMAQSGEDVPIAINDLTKMHGAWKSITHPDGVDNPPRLLQRVIVFHNSVNKSRIFAGAKESKLAFEQLVNKAKNLGQSVDNNVEVRHIDASTRTSKRGENLEWLRRSDMDENTCRVLTNARCLQEGVDVPSLDGVIFMDPKASKIDIIQSIGRVMRKPNDGKKQYGYVILPIPVPAGEDAFEVLDKSRGYKQIVNVLKAILAHDDRLMALLQSRLLLGDYHTGDPNLQSLEDVLEQLLGANTGRMQELVKSIVLDLRDEAYYARRGIEMGNAAKTIEEIIKTKALNDSKINEKLDAFHEDLQKVVGTTLNKTDSIKALSQHVVLYKIFNMLFPEGFQNPISQAMEQVIPSLNLKAELEKFAGFYKDVEKDIEVIDTPQAKQEFIKTIYDSFLRGADKKSATRLGVVYTPIEIVDFIIHSVNHVLKTEFDTSFADPHSSIKVLEPFVGAGTFLARLLESGIIPHDRLYENYKKNIYANEIMLLAYYVASVNVESTYQSLMQGHRYVPFDGISLTDTFDQDPQYRTDPEYHGKQSKFGETFREAHTRVQSQKGAHLHVIIGNPPYSGGQKSANEDNRNVSHRELEQRIRDTYKKRAPKGNTRGLDNPYIKAFRWASDRIGASGIIGFVTPSNWVRGHSEAGLRVCLEEEFTDVWCFDLQGNANLQGEAWRKSGDKIFGGGSREPIGITILVKNPKKKDCTIHYKKIDDYLKLDQKFEIIKNSNSIAGINNWKPISPNKYKDWVDQRGEKDERFNEYMPIGSDEVKKNKTNKALFSTYSRGLGTSRDDWVYNASKSELEENMKRHIDYCNSQDLDYFIVDKTQAKKNDSMIIRMKQYKKKGYDVKFDESQIRKALYRPFIKQYLYCDYVFNHESTVIMPFFPSPAFRNPTITVPDKNQGAFSAHMTDCTPDLNIHAPTQCFPLKTKKNIGKNVSDSAASRIRSQFPDPNSLRQPNDNSAGQDSRQILGVHNEHDPRSGSGTPRAVLPNEGDEMKDNITDWALEKYKAEYEDNTITKEDIFYYVYGVLHHLGYRKKYRNSLVRDLPHIPLAPTFWVFSKAGRELADLHLNYDACQRHNLGEPLARCPENPTSIRFGPKGKDKPHDSMLIVNGVMIYDNLPHVDYEVNGLTPVGWLTFVPKKSDAGIDRRPFRLWSGEQLRETAERLVYVGLESDRIMKELAKHEFEPGKDWQPAKTGLDAHMQSGAFQSAL